MLNCPFCYSDNQLIFKANQKHRHGNEGSNILRCPRCEIIYPEKRMGKQESEEYIKKVYCDVIEKDFKKNDDITVEKNDVIVKIISELGNGGNSLDIGAYDGRFCHVLNMLGYDAYGIEPQKKVVEHAQLQGRKIYNGYFPDEIPDEISGRKYKLISIMEAFYYVEDIEKSMKIIDGMLDEGGAVIIKCHQGNSRYYENNSMFSRYGDNVQGIPTINSLMYYLKSKFVIKKIVGIHDKDCLPKIYGKIESGFARRVICKIYNYFQLDVENADRIVVVAAKKY